MEIENKDEVAALCHNELVALVLATDILMLAGNEAERLVQVLHCPVKCLRNTSIIHKDCKLIRIVAVVVGQEARLHELVLEVFIVC